MGSKDISSNNVKFRVQGSGVQGFKVKKSNED